MNMIGVKTSELVGAALDWAVAKSTTQKHWPVVINAKVMLDTDYDYLPYSPSTDWAQGGPLLEKYKLHLHCDEPSASFLQSGMRIGYTANTVLIAACRAIVAAKIGDVVSVPSELLEPAK